LVSIQAFNGGRSRSILPIRAHSEAPCTGRDYSTGFPTPSANLLWFSSCHWVDSAYALTRSHANARYNFLRVFIVMTTIYLSSTYEDLKQYRSVVFDALRKSGHRVIAMEDYVAADQQPVDKCLKDVSDANLYIGVFAFRYGYVPPETHGNPDRLSIAELEFRAAESLKKPCLTFIVNESKAWPPMFDDARNAEDKG